MSPADLIAPEPGRYAMSLDEFWRIIGLLDWAKTGDDEAVVEPCVQALSTATVEQLHGFNELLARMLYALDTREHARYCYLGEADPDNGNDYISADDFLYSRCVVVANGREFFEQVASDPTQMPQDVEFEALLYIADEAYGRATDGDELDSDTEFVFESFSNGAGWAPSGSTAPGVYTDQSVPPGNRRPS